MGLFGYSHFGARIGLALSLAGALSSCAAKLNVPVPLDEETVPTIPLTTSNGLSISPTTRVLSTNASVTFTASGGTEPYSFDVHYGGGSIGVSSGAYSAPASPGDAVIRALDAEGRAAYGAVLIIDAPIISPSTASLAVNNPLSFSVWGGKPPYSFSVMSGSGTVNASTGQYVAPNSVGTAVVRVTDTAERSSEASITVTAALSLTPKNSSVLMNGTTNFLASGGVPPYTYSVASGQGSIDSAGAFAAPATPGVTALQVIDSLGNFDITLVTINNPLEISPKNSYLPKNATLQLSASGGVPPYSYSMQAGTGSVSATGLYTAPAGAGSATIRVTDLLSNFSDATLTITEDLTFKLVNVTMTVGSSLDLSTFVSGGVPPYAFAAVVSNGSLSGSTYTAPNVAGTYTVTVYDSQSPTPNNATASVIVNPALSISPTSTTLAPANTASFTASGGVPPYVYSLSSGNGSIDSSTGIYAAGAAAGSAQVQIQDSAGTIRTATITINNALAISPSSSAIVTGATQSFSASGGVAPYTYSLVSGGGEIHSSTGLFTAPGASGTAVVRARDALGNTSDAFLLIVNPLSLSPPTISLLKGSGVVFSATGGEPPYSYSISSGAGSLSATTGAYTAPASAGSATILATDSAGRTQTAAVTIYDGLTIIPFTRTLAVSQSVTFSATGGVAPYSYAIANGVGSLSGATYSSASSGTAIVRVTDAAGNTSDASVLVNPALAISPTSATLAVNNTKAFAASGGVPPNVFSVSAGVGSINANTGDYTAPSSEGAGIATVQLTDSTGASVTASISINAALSLSPSTGTRAAGATQLFTPSGGVAPYAYSVVSGGGSFSGATYTAPSTASGASIQVRVTDDLGNFANASLTVPPITVAISAPNSSAIINDSNKAAIAVSGVCSEEGRVVNVAASGSLTASPSCTGGLWSTTLNFTAVVDGPIIITADHANAQAVAAAQASVSLTKDGTAPTLAITTPTGGSFITATNKAAFLVSGTCSESGRTVTLGATGGFTAYTACSAGTFSKNLDLTSLSDGAITITADHTDASGNAATQASVSVTKNTAIPTVSISSPTILSVINSSNQSSFAASGTCSENTRIVTVGATGGLSATPTCSGGSWNTTLNFAAVSDGSITITADHQNAAGNAATQASVTLTKDATAPTSIAITAPGAGAYVNSANQAALTISGTCSENGTSNVTVKAGSTTLGAVNCASNTFSGSFDLSAISNGAVSLTAVLSDLAGNTLTSSAVSVTKDSSAPSSIAITTPSAGAYVNNSNKAAYTVSGSCSENGTGNVAVKVGATTLNSVDCSSGAFTGSFDLSAISDGAVSFTAVLTDDAGNSLTSSAVGVTKDIVAPTSVAITTPSAGAYVNDSNKAAFTISGSCSEAGTGNITVKAGATTLGTADCSASAFTGSFDFTVVSDGAVSLSAVLSDAAGNTLTSSAVSLTKDVSVPSSVAITTPSAGSYVNDSNKSAFSISGSCSEAGTNNVTVKAGATTLGSVNCASNAFTGSFDLSAISDGSVSLTAVLSDTVGNSLTSSAVSITKDVAAPSSVAITTPSAGGYVNNANKAAYTISGTCSEAGTANVTVKAGSTTLGTANCGSGSFTGAFNLTSISDGVVSLTAVLSDAAGNSLTSSAVDITKDVAAPTSVAISTPSAGGYVNNTSKAAFTISGSCSEAGTGNVAVKAGATTLGTANCSSSAFTGSFDLTSISDGAVSLTAVISDAAGNTLTSSAVGVTKDIVAPSAPASINDQTWKNSATASPSITWNTVADSDLSHYEVAVGSAAGGSDIADWTSTTNAFKTFSGLTLTDGQSYYGSVRAVDQAGNASSATQGDGWTVDATPPTAPGSVNDGSSKASLSDSPPISWNASSDATSGIAYYEVAIGTTSGGNDTRDWTNVGNVITTTATGLNLSAGTSYYASIRSVDAAGNVSEVSQGDGWLAVAACPAGYIEIPALSGYTSTSFCVAKYEAKQSGSVAVSLAAGTPWISINQAAAITACRANGAAYDLITNTEWQAVARNIELVPSNWSTGTIGSGAINRGNSNSNQACAGTDGEYGLNGNGGCTSTTDFTRKRTHTLSNGEIIWDFAGNVLEYVSDTNSTNYGTNTYFSQITSTSHTAVSSDGLASKAKFGPTGTYTSLGASEYGGLGYAWMGYTNGAILRGGSWSLGAQSGVFSALLYVATTYTNIDIGFRCTYRPVEIAPAPIAMSPNQTMTFTASKGTPPYTYSIVSGGGSINPSTGAYTSPAGVGTAVIRVTDSLSATSDSTVSIIQCPANYIPVGPLAPYTSQPFCAARYEAKQSGAVAVSQAAGSPWVNVTQATAITACQANGSGYGLISNAHWQSIARSVEGVASNWSSGSIGTGSINRGNSNSTQACTGNDGEYGLSAAGGCTSTADFVRKRTHTLSNGETIWDLAGNVLEYVSDTNSTNYGATSAFISQITASSHTATASDGLAAKAKFGPAGSYTSLGSTEYGGLGYAWTGFTNGAILRGGGWSFGTQAGIFSALLYVGTTYTAADIGFRCVYDPVQISPRAAAIDPSGSATFSASGGTGAYTYSIVSGGGSIDPSTGVYSAPATPGTSVIRVTDDLGNTSDSTVETLSCPSGYVSVPALSGYTTSAFCVAKYEAKQSGSVATSVPAGNPWVSITRDAARTACQANGAAYDLISNAQWQALARNIESVAANWSSGVIGSAGSSINLGHSDSAPGNSLAAVSDDNDPCNGTGQTCNASAWDSQRRTHKLSNDKIVWDLAGNVHEWVRDDNFVNYGGDNYMSQVTLASHPVITWNGQKAKSVFGPAGNYTSLAGGNWGGLGYSSLNYSAGAIFRGGSYGNSTGSGIFRVQLDYGAATANGAIGFRCVYQP